MTNPAQCRFLSTYPGRIDGKGRVSVPAPFRTVLEADGHPGVFVHPALEVPALECGGNRLLAGIDLLIERFSPYSEERDLMATALLGSAEVLRFDPEGRISLPERLRAHLGGGVELMFVGLGERFRLWSAAAFSAHLDGAKSRLRAVRAQLSGPGGKSGAEAAGPLRGVRET